MINRRRFVQGSGAIVASAISLPVFASAQADHGCDGARLGARQQEYEEFSCQSSDFTEVDGFLYSSSSNNNQLIAEFYAAFESDSCSFIETRLTTETTPEGLPLLDARERFLDRQVPGLNLFDPDYKSTVGLSTKPTGYTANVGHSQPLQDANGRSGYFLKVMACAMDGTDATGVPTADATTVSSTFVATETAESFEMAPLAENGSPRLGADSSAWIEAYGEGTEGENGTTAYPDLMGSPNVAFARQMRGDSKVQEIAAYGIDAGAARDLIVAYLPPDATLESTFLLPGTPNAPFALRLQQWTSASLQVPIMSLYIDQGDEDAADVDAVILSQNGQMIGWTTGV